MTAPPVAPPNSGDRREYPKGSGGRRHRGRRPPGPRAAPAAPRGGPRRHTEAFAMRPPPTLIPFLCLAAGLVGGSARPAGALDLVVDGKPRATIVVDASARPAPAPAA